MMTLILPWPPSVNHYKKVGAVVKTKTGKIYQKRINSVKATNFYYEVYLIAREKMPSEWGKFARSETITFKVYVSLFPPDNRRRDIDNGLKVIFDSLVRAKVINDDSQITRLYVQKMENIRGGRIIVEIFPLWEPEEDAHQRS